MKKHYVITLLVAALVFFGAATAQAAKVTICHIPPGNPANWHTITISTNALQTHLDRHGDFEGSCVEVCDQLCDDGNACTQDVIPDLDECICATDPTPVDCDDSNSCTADSCDPATGSCLNDILVPDGDVCEDEGGAAGSCDLGVCETGGGDVCGGCATSCAGLDPYVVYQSCEACNMFLFCDALGEFLFEGTPSPSCNFEPGDCTDDPGDPGGGGGV